MVIFDGGMLIDGDGSYDNVTQEEITKLVGDTESSTSPLEKAVTTAEQNLADAEQALKDAKGKGVTAVLEAKAAVVDAKKELETAQISLDIGQDVSGMSRTDINRLKIEIEERDKATERSLTTAPAYQGAPADQVIYKYDVTQRPEGKIQDGFIIYYSWVGSGSTGEWRDYRAPLTEENMIKYGSRVFGGTTQASFGASSEGANTLTKQPMLTKDQYGNIIGYNLDGTEFTFSGFKDTSGSTDVGTITTNPSGNEVTIISSVKNADGSTTVTYSDGTTKIIPASTSSNTSFPKIDTNSITDPNTLALIKSLQDQIAKLTAGNQQSAADKAAADAAAKKEKAENAITVLTDRFTRYGLASLVPKIKELAIGGASESTITLQLQETEEYRQRFRANQDRIKKGLSVLDPGDYLGLEDDYRQILRAYGLRSFDNDDYVQQFISNDISTTELTNRVVTAVQRVQNADPAILTTLRGFYGITDNDLVAYVLDPQQQFQKIERQVAAAEIGAAAKLQGINAGVAVSEQLAAQGITKAQAQKGYATIADILPTAEKLSDIYGKTLDEYRLGQAEQEVFNTLASAQRKRQKLSEREIAAFSGTSGVGKSSLSTQLGGTF